MIFSRAKIDTKILLCLDYRRSFLPLVFFPRKDVSSCFNVENIRTIKYISLAKNLIGHPSGKEKNPGREELRRHPGSTQIPSLFLASERERGREGGGCRFDRGIKNRGDRVDPEFRAIRFRLWPSGGGGVSTLPLVIFFSPLFFFFREQRHDPVNRLADN